MGVKLNPLPYIYHRDQKKNFASVLYSSDLWVNELINYHNSTFSISWHSSDLRLIPCQSTRFSIGSLSWYSWKCCKCCIMEGDQPVTQRSDECRLSDPIENVVLWQGISSLSNPKVWCVQTEWSNWKCYIMAGDQLITWRSDESQLRDPTENVILWQRSSSLPKGLMSIYSAIRVKMLYYSRGSVRYPKVW